MVKRRAVFAMWLVLCASPPPALAAETPAPSTAPTARTADEWAAVASQQLKDGDRDAAIEALELSCLPRGSREIFVERSAEALLVL